MKLLSLAPVLVIALLVASACAGDDNSKSTPLPSASASPTPLGSRSTSPSPTVPPADSDVGLSLSEWVIKMDRTRARPGTVTFKARNEGAMKHQLVVVRTDLSKAELPRKPNEEGVDESQLTVVGRIDSIDPGATGELKVSVQEGKYVVFCNFFKDGTSHYLKGMYQQLDVTPTAPLENPPTSPVTPSPIP